MGKRGPAKRPAELKLLEGTFRADRDSIGPKPEPIKPDVPEWIGSMAIEIWQQLAPKLEKLGLLTQIDGDEFSRYCLYAARQQQAEADINSRGLLVPGAVPGTTVKNPAVQIARDYGQAASRLAAKFGMTPSDRNGIAAHTEPDEGEGIESLLSGL